MDVTSLNFYPPMHDELLFHHPEGMKTRLRGQYRAVRVCGAEDEGYRSPLLQPELGSDDDGC